MENILKQFGILVSSKKENNEQISISTAVIKNNDGTPRWIWNAQNTEPLFLKFYAASNLKAKAFCFIVKMIFRLRLQKLIFTSQKYFITNTENSFFNIQEPWALFTGTIGPNNKALLFTKDHFYKIATTPNAVQLLQNEMLMTSKVKSEIKNIQIPNYNIITDNILQISDLSKNGKRNNSISKIHIEALEKMKAIHSNCTEIKNWRHFQNITEEFHTIRDSRIPQNLLRKLTMLLEQIHQNEKIELHFSHGDFTPWNMYENKNKLQLYDWELAQENRVKGFDFFHFIIQKGILVDRKNWKQIHHELKEAFHLTSNSLFRNKEEFKNYLKWYLLTNCMEYLIVYSKQPKWHLQVTWLLNTWNDALNLFLQNQKNQRELVIMDFFDMIQNTAYAALKFPNDFPENLSINSDIDLLILKENYKPLLKQLQNHSLISKISRQKKSFMDTLQIFTLEGSLLSIDLIWKIKRKNLVMLNSNRIIKDNYTNGFGVKMASVIDTTRYIALFYILNGAKIPKKYLVYHASLTNSKKTIDKTIQDYFIDKKRSQNSLVNLIKKDKQNKNFRFLRNTFDYGVDCFRKIIQSKGYIITFSGVDGAGKSTVIENISQQIEKQLRKPVVILRHRPSLLPILSVWTKGKEKAHLDTSNNLPRQGKNNSFFSSIIRFSYYYLDYTLGQFVIYCKYLSRGYVVIYDRYYFDFINDSKRSNIVLPKFIPQLGYSLIMKPKFNFFLFADSQTILKRKKELNKDTIEKLTQDYLILFNRLNHSTKKTTYKAIENYNLNATLNLILRTIYQH